MSFLDLPPEILDRIHQYLPADDSLSFCFVNNHIFSRSLAGTQVFKNLFDRCWLGNESYEEAKFVVMEIQKNWKESKSLDDLNEVSNVAYA